jgi:hypothetical protein
MYYILPTITSSHIFQNLSSTFILPHDSDVIFIKKQKNYITDYWQIFFPESDRSPPAQKKKLKTPLAFQAETRHALHTVKGLLLSTDKTACGLTHTFHHQPRVRPT